MFKGEQRRRITKKKIMLVDQLVKINLIEKYMNQKRVIKMNKSAQTMKNCILYAWRPKIGYPLGYDDLGRIRKNY